MNAGYQQVIALEEKDRRDLFLATAIPVYRSAPFVGGVAKVAANSAPSSVCRVVCRSFARNVSIYLLKATKNDTFSK